MPDLGPTLTLIVINGLLAWSLWLPLAGGQMAFAVPGSAAIGAYSAGHLAIMGHQNLALQLLVGAGLGALFGIPLGLLAVRLRGFALAIATVGVAEMIRITVQTIKPLGGPQGLVGIVPSEHTLAVGVVAVLVIGLVFWRLSRSSVGRVVDVVEADEVQAAALGVRINLVKISLLVVSSSMAAFAGVLGVRYSGLAVPEQFSLHLTIALFAYVALGGVRTFWGPLLGAAFLTFGLQELDFAGELRFVVYGLVIVLVMLLRRDGLIQRSTARRAQWVQRLPGERWGPFDVPKPRSAVLGRIRALGTRGEEA